MVLLSHLYSLQTYQAYLDEVPPQKTHIVIWRWVLSFTIILERKETTNKQIPSTFANPKNYNLKSLTPFSCTKHSLALQTSLCFSTQSCQHPHGISTMPLSAHPTTTLVEVLLERSGNPSFPQALKPLLRLPVACRQEPALVGFCASFPGVETPHRIQLRSCPYCQPNPRSTDCLVTTQSSCADTKPPNHLHLDPAAKSLGPKEGKCHTR